MTVLTECLLLLLLLLIYYYLSGNCLEMATARRCAATTEEVKKRLNEAFDHLYTVNEAGRPVPYVCLICDKYVNPWTMEILKVDKLISCRNILAPNTWNKINPNSPLAVCNYTYLGNCGSRVGDDDREHIENMLLSPRGCFVNVSDDRSNEGFVVCGSCKYGLDRNQMPKRAIANNYLFGSPPPCLTELTEIELAMLTPINQARWPRRADRRARGPRPARGASGPCGRSATRGRGSAGR